MRGMETTRAFPVNETTIWRTPVGEEYVAKADYDRLREAARQVIGTFMADRFLDDTEGKWNAAINELEDAADLGQQTGS